MFIYNCTNDRPSGPSDLIFRNCSKNVSFFSMFKCKSSSHYSPVHFLSTTVPHRGPNPRKQRPYFGDPRRHIIQKNTGFGTGECFHP